MEFIYDRTESDVVNRTAKGYLNAGDLSRIESNISELAGYKELILEIKTWEVGGLPRDSDFARILANITALQEVYAVWEMTPVVPVQPLNTYQKWNDIEHILHDMYWNYIFEMDSRYYCGEGIGCGDEIGVI